MTRDMKSIKDIISKLSSCIARWKRLFQTSAFAFRPSPSNRGYTLVEAATVVMISGAMAIVTVPIVSDKMEEGKISSAKSTVNAIEAALSKYTGDTQTFPTKVIASGVALNVVQVLRSGIRAANEDLSTLDPFLAKGDDSLWKVVNPPDGEVIDNFNDHLVSDAQGYAKAGFTWLGPYVPTIDQDPWGRNYMIYARAFYTEKDFSEDPENGKALYAWVISSGPDKTIETEPTDSDLQGDDIGVSISTPKSVAGISDNKTSNLQSIKAPNAPPDISEAP